MDTQSWLAGIALVASVVWSVWYSMRAVDSIAKILGTNPRAEYKGADGQWHPITGEHAV